jgi:serine/threonine protein kinase
MEYSVESLCNQMARSRLLAPNTIRSLRRRYRTAAGTEADDGEKFGRWLVANQQVTDFQLGLMTRGFGDMLYFGEYKLLDRIGQGRMAGIYKAIHPTGQVVAVKVLPPSRAANAQLLGRFQREARLALRLHHPNVVRAFQRGQTRGGLHFIVMEFLAGQTLEELLKRRQRLPVSEAAYVLVQAFQGLQYLHEEGLVHRDLKPANLMLVPGQTPDQADFAFGTTAKILDMGLGRALFDLEEGTDGQEQTPELTTEGCLLGTPNYMAPEQARSARLADIRSDCYSLGCVLYEVLTGQPPFPDTSFVRQMIRHATETPRPLMELLPTVPEGFQTIMNSLLAKDPAQRFSTPAQAARALKPFIEPGVGSAPGADDAPQLRSYLTWLETAPAEPPEEELAGPTKVVVGPATERDPVVPAPASEPSPPQPVAAVPVQPPPTALPIAHPVPNGMTASPPGAVPIAQPIIVSARRRPQPAGTSLARRLSGWFQERGISHRDLAAAAVGVGGILILEALIWLIVRLFR